MDENDREGQASGPDPYGGLAKVYDRITSLFMRGPRNRLGQLLREYGVVKVLDLGCGTGALLHSLRQKGFEGYGADCSPAMLAQAYRKNPGKVVRADGIRPPFKDMSFDAVIFSLILHETGERGPAILRQAFRLAPMVFLIEWRIPERNLDYPLTGWTHLVERAAGKEHYRAYRRFLALGGVYGLAGTVDARVVRAESQRGGSMMIAVLQPDTEAISTFP